MTDGMLLHVLREAMMSVSTNLIDRLHNAGCLSVSNLYLILPSILFTTKLA